MEIRFPNEKGFSTKIFSVIVLFLVGLVFVGLELKKGLKSKKTVRNVSNILDQYNFERGIQNILNDKDSCRVSLAGDGPEGQPRDPIKVPLGRMQRTGMAIELWESDESGMERGKLMYSALEKEGRKHGTFSIKSMKLVFPSGQKKFSGSSHSTVQGIIKVTVKKMISLEQSLNMHFHFPLGVKLFTKRDGETTVLTSCVSVKGRKKKNQKEDDEAKGKNVLLGENAGTSIKKGKGNIFIGENTGIRTVDGINNIVIGGNSGVNNVSGNSNIYIGPNIPDKSDDDSKLNIGRLILGRMPDPENKDELSWTGDRPGIVINGNLLVQGTMTQASSRHYKRNIEPFEQLENSWNDVLDIPFFTYRHIRDEPQKKRLGIVAEELPNKFQIAKSKGFVLPDWISLQGSFWASVKALVIEFKDMKKRVDTIEDNGQELKKIQEELERLRRDLRKLRRDYGKRIE